MAIYKPISYQYSRAMKAHHSLILSPSKSYFKFFKLNIAKIKNRHYYPAAFVDSQSEYITNLVCSKANEQLSKSEFDCA